MPSKQVYAKFIVVNEEEDIFSETGDGHKLGSKRLTLEYCGDISGESALIELRNYSNKENASVYGLERVNGTFAGKTGSFVLEHIGILSLGRLISTRKIIAGSGTGDLRNLRGVWHFSAEGEEQFDVVFDYYFEEDKKI